MIAACEWIFGARPLADTLRVLREAGLDGLEVSGEPSRDPHAVADQLEAAGLTASGTTAVCLWPTDERDLAHAEPEARRRAVAYYRGCVDVALAVGARVVGLIPAAVGRLDVLTSYEREWRYAADGLREVALYAGERGVTVAVEPINRYETHLVNRVEQALTLAADAGVDGVGVIADAFHMQLEETSSEAAIELAGSGLAALHLADSNRLGLGRGQLALAPLIQATRRIHFSGPLVLECTAPGPSPFQPDKGPGPMAELDRYVHESAEALRRL